MIKKKLVIIGAGLSGLYLATQLKEMFTITILEARDRVGGRILTKEGHDLGPSWIWSHQKHILTLVKDLGLELFPQYTKGEALYDSPEGVQRFKAPPSAPSARVKGGLKVLIDALVKKLPKDMIFLKEEVKRISYKKEILSVITENKTYEADYVVSTLAPRLACKNIVYEPELAKATKEQLLRTPTWMGNSAKCVIEFKEAFWKVDGLSGFIYSPLGPLGEIHDASTDEKPALFGFVSSNNSYENIEVEVRKQMKRLFGDKSKMITGLHCIDWKKEKFSSSSLDKKSLSSHPEYGLSLNCFEEHLFFSGTETAYDNGGYLEGAIIAAVEISERLIKLSKE